MNKFDHCILSSSERGLNIESNPDFCDSIAALYQLSYQVNWERVVISVDYEPVDVEIDDDNTGTFHLFEMWTGMKLI